MTSYHAEMPRQAGFEKKYLGGSFERSIYDLRKAKLIHVLEYLNSEGLL